MIYFLSDFHGGEATEGLRDYLTFCRPDDWLIVLGDVGLQFENTAANRAFTDWFLALTCRIAIVDGNHENNAFLASFPEEDWCGGKIHRLSPSIVHLQRGYIFDIEGKRFFVMGGCKSSAKWKEQGLWYAGECPDEAELRRGYASLQACGNAVDYVLTHAYWREEEMPTALQPPTVEELITYIDEAVSFTHWYSGHRHWEGQLDEKHTVVYKTPVALV